MRVPSPRRPGNKRGDCSRVRSRGAVSARRCGRAAVERELCGPCKGRPPHLVIALTPPLRPAPGPGFQPDPQLCSPCGWPQAHGSGSARSNKRPRSVGPAATTPLRSDPGDTRGVRGRPQLTHPAPAAAASSPVACRARSVPADEAALTELLCVAGRLDTQMRLSILASLQRLASGYAARTQAAGEGGVTGMPPGALGARKETAQPGGAEGVARGVDESVTALLFHHFWDEAR